jgi:5'-nucleotidase
MRMFTKPRLLAALVAVAFSPSALALDIVISNDDGFESAYSHALYQKLKAAGHRIILSASTQDQSGQGSASSGMRPMTELTKDTRAGSVKAGAPSFGALPGDDAVNYVDGSPGMAVLYAIDKLAPTLWHKRPDLVISGPNYGNNLAGAAVGSGTIAAALFAVNRGVPAIAVSDAHSFHYRGYQKLAEGDIDYEIADVTLKLVSQLEQQAKKTHKPLLPPGIGLNVNIPAFAPGTGKSIRYRLTRLGKQAMMYYSDDLSQDPNVKAFGINMPAAPGFSWAVKEAPAALDLPADSDQQAEIVAIKTGVVTISVMEGIPQANTAQELAVKHELGGLISRTK